MKKYELVFLDVDDTLFDFKKAEKNAFTRSFDEFGLEPTEDAFRKYEVINSGLWKQLERGETTQEKLKVERFALLFQAMGNNVDAVDFSRTFVRWLSKGTFLLDKAETICEYLGGKYRLAIITNGIHEVQKSRIDNSAIRKYIRDIIISGEVKCSKPGREIFEHACRAAGFHDREKIIMIGDSLSSDIQGGINFGIDTCWVNPASAKNDTGIAPTYEVRSLLDIKNIL